MVIVIVIVILISIVGMDAAGAEVGVGTVVAVVFLIADIVEGSEFGAVWHLLGGLDGLGSVEVLLAINEARGDSETVEKNRGLSQIKAIVDDSFADAGDGELDRGRILGRGEHQGAKPQVGLFADRVDLGVVVAEPTALEDGGLAAEPVGLDVATCHEHALLL